MSEDGPADVPMANWPAVRAIDGAAAVLAGLTRTRRIALATNATVSDRADVERALTRAGLRAFVSELFCFRELGCTKREPAFWEAVVARTGARRDELLVVGDDLENDVLAPRPRGHRGGVARRQAARASGRARRAGHRAPRRARGAGRAPSIGSVIVRLHNFLDAIAQ